MKSCMHYLLLTTALASTATTLVTAQPANDTQTSTTSVSSPRQTKKLLSKKLTRAKKIALAIGIPMAAALLAGAGLAVCRYKLRNDAYNHNFIIREIVITNSGGRSDEPDVLYNKSLLKTLDNAIREKSTKQINLPSPVINHYLRLKKSKKGHGYSGGRFSQPNLHGGSKGKLQMLYAETFPQLAKHKKTAE